MGNKNSREPLAHLLDLRDGVGGVEAEGELLRPSGQRHRQRRQPRCRVALYGPNERVRQFSGS